MVALAAPALGCHRGARAPYARETVSSAISEATPTVVAIRPTARSYYGAITPHSPVTLLRQLFHADTEKGKFSPYPLLEAQISRVADVIGEARNVPLLRCGWEA
jgi:hypothetical protein